MEKNSNNTRLVDKLFKTDDDSAALYVLVGKSRKGKSHLARYILMNRLLSKQWHFGLVFCKSKFNNDYTSFLPDNRIYEGYNEQVLMKYVNNLKKIVKEKGKVPASFIIFDDLIGVLNNATDWFNNFISTFRHVNINVFICVQYLTGKNAVSPIMREQTNFAILFQSRTRRTTSLRDYTVSRPSTKTIKIRSCRDNIFRPYPRPYLIPRPYSRPLELVYFSRGIHGLETTSSGLETTRSSGLERVVPRP